MSFKVMMVGRRRPGQTLVEHRAHMKDVHGAIVLDYIRREPEHAPRRYVQNHIVDGIFPGGEGKPDVFAYGMDFVTEIGFPDLASLKASRETDFYKNRLLPDEPRMVDVARVVGIPSNEISVRTPDGNGEGRFKVFLFWHGDLPDTGALSAAVGSLAASALGHSRNEPAVPAPVKAIDCFWLADEATAATFAAACRDTILNKLPEEQQSFSIAIAREHVLHAG